MEAAMKAVDQTRTAAGTHSDSLLALGCAAIGYATCFDTALAITAQRMKKNIASSRTSAKLGMDRTAGSVYGLGVDLYVEVRGLPKADARKLVETTHRVCPYSDALRNTVNVRLHVTVT